MSTAAGPIATCIGCGCDDDRACNDGGRGCSWTRLDYVDGVGVCSRCPDHETRWDTGDREPQIPQLAP